MVRVPSSSGVIFATTVVAIVVHGHLHRPGVPSLVRTVPLPICRRTRHISWAISSISTVVAHWWRVRYGIKIVRGVSAVVWGGTIVW